MPVYILGLDPGSRYTGYGVIAFDPQQGTQHVDHGVISPSATMTFAQKLHFIAGRLSEVLSQWPIEQMIIEKIFVAKNVDSAFKLGHVRGVCLYQATEYQVEVHEIAARAAKKQITGNGAASKDQMRTLVTHLLGLSGEIPWDASDALALALCRSRQLEIDSLHRRGQGATL